MTPIDSDARQASRKPRGSRSARMAPLATLPVFLKAQNMTAVVAGNSLAALWKAELLAASGARVKIFAAEPVDDFAAFLADAPTCEFYRRNWSPKDLMGAKIAICDETIDILAFREAAANAGALVNAIDRPLYCDMQFGSIVNRSPLVIALSTDGTAPVFGQALRQRLEILIPENFRAWMLAARNWRSLLEPLKLDFRARRQFWERFTTLALSRPHAMPTDADRDALFQPAEQDQNQKRGKAFLVGAGPGGAEFLTLKAAQALQSADLVMYDDLVGPDVLDLARREAERLNVGKRGHKPSCGQDEICALLVKHVSLGKYVVRLKGGDPMIFGRANEEIMALRDAGLDVETIPGVTAASAAAASLLTSLTERDVARRVQFVTAHSREGILPDDLNWAALADPKASTAVYMGVATMPALVARLLVEKLDPATPCVFVERASQAQERRIAATLATILEAVKAQDGRGPALLLIGEAFRNARI